MKCFASNSDYHSLVVFRKKKLICTYKDDEEIVCRVGVSAAEKYQKQPALQPLHLISKKSCECILQENSQTNRKAKYINNLK